MAFVYGTALLVASILLLGFAKFAVTRFENSSWVRNFAATETMALAITMISAFGIAFLCAGIARDSGGLGLVELAASLGVIALAVIAVVRIFRMAVRTQAPAGAQPVAAPPRPGSPAAV